MSRFKSLVAKSIYKIDKRIDTVSYRLSSRFSDSALVVLPYLSYGRQDHFFVKGRVLKAKSIQPADEDASFWENFKNAYRRFASREIPNAELEVSVGGQKVTLQTDEEGYFEGRIALEAELPNPDDLFQPYTVELLSPIRDEQEVVCFSGTVMVPRDNADFGIISDIDDTVLKTDATSILSMAKKTLFGNARTRLPFDGVAEFYSALSRGGHNPLFYVSSSPWNLYDVLAEFLDINDIPAGPLMLRDWGTSPTEFLPTSHSSHKLDAIKGILDTYPNLPFVLIGDSGQEDPEIYVDIVKNYPERIKMVYIRDVSEKASRDEKIKHLDEELQTLRGDLMLIPDTQTAMDDAEARGLI